MSLATDRLAWVDNIRTAMVFLVVNMHACVTYSHVGGWYLKVPPEPSIAAKIPFLYWQGHLQAFFMGLLFFIAGFFAHGSCLRRGPVGFLGERFRRLGVPTIAYMFGIQPLILYVLLRKPDWPPTGELYLRYLTSQRVLYGSGPLWFAIALLIFSSALAVWRFVRPPPFEIMRKLPPKFGQVAVFALVLASTTFIIRLFQPMDTNFFNLQLCFFPQYVGAFWVGVQAGRSDWLESFSRSTLAARLGWLGLIGGPFLLTTVMVEGGVIKTGDFEPYKGGWHGQALALATWEQLSGVALGAGVLALFQRQVRFNGWIARWLAKHSFAVYALHAPILVAMTPHVSSLPSGLVVKVLTLTTIGFILSHVAAAVVKVIPGLNRVY